MERHDNNVKICQFWGKEFMSLSQKYEERVQSKSHFSHDNILKQLHRCLNIFDKHLSELYWIILMCF